MSRGSKIALCTCGAILAYVAWVSWPYAPDRAELSDTCSSPNITNEKYRGFIAEAKTSMRGHSGDLVMRSPDSNNIAPTSTALNEVFTIFIKRSATLEELMMRIHAFGRALDGRSYFRRDSEKFGVRKAEYPGPGGGWGNENIAIAGSPSYFSIGQEFQAPQWIAGHDWGNWAWARLFGRRYELLRIGVSFNTMTQFPITPEDLLARYLPDAKAGAGLSRPFNFSNDASWGDRRIPNLCPDISTARSFIDKRLERGSN
jgi:hypothetical protein